MILVSHFVSGSIEGITWNFAPVKQEEKWILVLVCKVKGPVRIFEIPLAKLINTKKKKKNRVRMINFNFIESYIWVDLANTRPHIHLLSRLQ